MPDWRKVLDRFTTWDLILQILFLVVLFGVSAILVIAE
jgi:hypothetical protein